VLTRASYAGGQRYAATWTGDNSSSWNHLRMTTPMLQNLGLSGFAFSGADVGGFAGTPSPDLLTKWLEIAAFQPIDRDHTEKGTGDQEPWVGGAEQEAIRRRFIEERYRLMPYLYTLAEESSRTGLPMERPLFLEFPDAMGDHHPIDVDTGAVGEFLLGRNILIAPPHFPEELDAYSVEFPSADWYDYWTGEKVWQQRKPVSSEASMATVEANLPPLSVIVKPELSLLPVYVRAGSILPVAPLVQSVNETPKGPLTLRVYAGNDCSGELYLDDGKSYAYEHGAFLRMKFSCEVSSDGLRIHVTPREGSYSPWWKEIRAEVYGFTPKEISMGGKNIPFAARGSAIVFTVADDAEGFNVMLR